MTASMFGQAVGQGLIMLLLGRLAGPEALGAYSYAMALVIPILTACNLGLRSQLLSDFNHQTPYGYYQVVRLLGGSLGLAVTGVLAVVLGLAELVAWAVASVSVAKSAEFYADLGYGYWQREEQHHRIASSILIRSTLAVLGMYCGLQIFGDPVAGLAGTAIGSVLSVAVYDSHLVRKIIPKSDRTLHTWHWPLARKLFWNGIPLATSSFVNNANNSVPRVVLAGHFGLGPVGKLAVYFYGIQVMLMAVQALGHALGPRMARQFYTGDTIGFKHLWRAGLLIAVGSGVLYSMAMYICGEWVIEKIFGHQFLLGAGFGAILALGCIPMIVVGLLGFFLTAVRAFWAQLPLQIFILCLTVGLSVWLLPVLALDGVTWIWAASGAAGAIAMSGVLALRIREKGGSV